jgi:hypothetical protein
MDEKSASRTGESPVIQISALGVSRQLGRALSTSERSDWLIQKWHAKESHWISGENVVQRRPANCDTMRGHESPNLVISARYFSRQQPYWPLRHY